MGGATPIKLKASEIKADCEVRGATDEDYEAVIEIEKIAYKFVASQYKPAEPK